MSDVKLSLADIERFAYGEADELEDVIFSSQAYLDTLEEIWAEELPSDLQPAVLRAIQLEKLIGDVLGLTLDTSAGLLGSVLHYLEASIEDDAT